jgi:hypothetical protein
MIVDFDRVFILFVPPAKQNRVAGNRTSGFSDQIRRRAPESSLGLDGFPGE